MSDLEKALRVIDETDCEHRSHIVLPWISKAADRIAELEAENAKLRSALFAALDGFEVVIRDDLPAGELEWRVTEDGGLLVRRRRVRSW